MCNVQSEMLFDISLYHTLLRTNQKYELSPSRRLKLAVISNTSKLDFFLNKILMKEIINNERIINHNAYLVRVGHKPKANSLVFNISFCVCPPPRKLRTSISNHILIPIILITMIGYMISHFKSFVPLNKTRIRGWFAIQYD